MPVKLVDYAALAKRAGDVIINCTPVGMYPHEEASPVPAEILQNYDAAVDLIYNPPETMFLRKAKEKGCLTANGLLMLVAQAVYAEEIWLQKSIGEDDILRIARQLGGDRHKKHSFNRNAGLRQVNHRQIAGAKAGGRLL